jgi:hypothetical protein
VPSPAVDEIRRRYAADVAANRLRRSDRWAQPCLAYNVIIRPDPAGARCARALQRLVQRREPSLLAVPQQALHLSVAWLLPVHESDHVTKAGLWRAHGPVWLAGMADLAGRLSAFRMSIHDVVATDTAVIAIAEAPAQVSSVRRGIARLPGIGRVSAGEMAHVTLFRYAGRLADPASLLRELADLEADLHMLVTELQIVREDVFPALEFEVLRRFQLPSAGGR